MLLRTRPCPRFLWSYLFLFQTHCQSWYHSHQAACTSMQITMFANINGRRLGASQTVRSRDIEKLLGLIDCLYSISRIYSLDRIAHFVRSSINCKDPHLRKRKTQWSTWHRRCRGMQPAAQYHPPHRPSGQPVSRQSSASCPR